MSTYPVGTVAIATVRGVEGVRVFRDEDGTDWASAVRVKNALFHTDDVVTEIRPLVVLDLDEMALRGGWGSASNLIESLRSKGYSSLGIELHEQTKPLRIPEPGLHGVVKASLNGRATGETVWVHYYSGWYRAADDKARAWSALQNPVLIREGLS